MTPIGIKIQFSAVLTSILFAPSYSYAVDMNDLVLREGKYFQQFQTIPYSGEVLHRGTGWGASGQMKDGVRVGDWISFYTNGQLDWNGSYLNGCRDGKWNWYYYSGKVKARREYRSCKLNGMSVAYFENGLTKFRGEYREGSRNGPWVSYRDDFSIVFEGEYRNGKPVGDWVAFHKDGTVNDYSTGFFVDGIKSVKPTASSSSTKNTETNVEVDKNDCMVKFVPVLRHFC